MTTPRTRYAVLSVDNTRTFEDTSLNELYVSGGEQAAQETYNLMFSMKETSWLIYNVFEAHPEGHISFASNYIGKDPFTLLTREEVENWTAENNGIGPKAAFTLDELKKHLEENHAQMLWPDHSVENTPGVALMPPLQPGQFDRTIVKGTQAGIEEYSGFTNGKLHAQLQEDGIDTVIITGVATDYCVGLTALDAAKLGYRTYVLQEAIAGVAPETTDQMLIQRKLHGVKVITRAQLVEVFDRQND